MQINVRIKIVFASPDGVIATEAKKSNSNWVILDRYNTTYLWMCVWVLQMYSFGNSFFLLYLLLQILQQGTQV